MFTGIVEGKGKTVGLLPKGKGSEISVEAPFALSDDRIGDSIAVNGACLTVTAIKGNSFTAHISKETLSRTTLGGVKKGEAVNLERALKLCDRMGGHLVTGHIDGMGRLAKKESVGESVRLEIEADEPLLRYAVEKGSVAVDGVSLTINEVGKRSFFLNIIPHTLEVTTLGSIKTGFNVNLEMDIIGKYVERLMGGQKGIKGVDMTLLKEYGFA